MRRRLQQVLSLKPREGFVTALMFLYIFLILTFYYILKPMRSSFFLKNLPSTSLPYAYILTAVFAGTLTTLIFKFSRKISTIALITGTNLTVIGTLFYFRWAMGRTIAVLPYVWFVYLQIVSVLTVAQFWLLAGFVYDNRQAKRIYSLLGAGAIAGAIAGSFIPGYLSKNLSTNTRLLICVSICGALIVLAQAAWRYRRHGTEMAREPRRFEEPTDRLSDLFRLVLGSRHLSLMVLLVFFTLIASQIAEWQVNNALDTTYSGLPSKEKGDQIDQFWGRFYFWTNILGIALQLSFTGFVVARMGIGAAILFLPGSLFLASFGVFSAPSLSTASLALGSNNVFRYSINRAGLELLYLPLSPVIRKKLKLFVDVFIDRFGRAVAAIVILTFSTLRGTSVTTIVLTGISLVVCLRLRDAYVNAFRQHLARRELDLSEFDRYVTDPAAVRMLVEALGSGQERQILYSLRLLQNVRGEDFSGPLLPLLGHPSAFVREEAVRTLQALPGNHSDRAELLLRDASEGVRLAAVEYLCASHPEGAVGRLEALLSSEDIQIRLAAARCAAGQSEAVYKPSSEQVQALLARQGDGGKGRVAAAHLAVRLPAGEAIRILRQLLVDPDAEVARAAAQSAGAAGHLDLLFEVIPMLARRDLRNAARDALLQYGGRIAGTLGDVLGDSAWELAVRREIPWVLARIGNRRAAEVLVDNLEASDPLLKYRVVKALNRVHETQPELPVLDQAIARRIHFETRAYYEALTLYQALAPGAETGAGSLLVRALKERMDQDLEIIFRLLGLQYPQKDIYFAYSALKGDQADRRASAIEFLDNLLQKNLKSIILPLLEESSVERLVERAARLLGVQSKKWEEALGLILQQSDAWLKACALHEVGEKRLSQFADLCRRLTADREPIVRETAQWALQRCA